MQKEVDQVNSEAAHRGMPDFPQVYKICLISVPGTFPYKEMLRTGFINPSVRRVVADRAPAGPQPTTPIVRRGEDQWGGSRQDPPHEWIYETGSNSAGVPRL